MSVLDRLTAALADRYRLERELGAGGMATVYLAHDLKHDRDVAIKVLHPDLGAALGGERFLSEIRTTARLQHPHILPLLDSGSAIYPPPGMIDDRSSMIDHQSSSFLYYVMPLVTGETLRTRLERERQLPIADAVRIAREVASALDYAHRQGVIHRDIKPENILLHDGQALVADFGIALAVQSAGGQRMTQTGLSLGTPQYMSPEQAMGEKQIDARSDVYALAAVTYEMLAGDAPFTGGSVQAIVAKIMTEKPTPVHTLRDTVPEQVEDAVLTGLAKLPADRFESAKAFADALGSPVSSGTRSSALRSRVFRPDWRQRFAIPALGVAAMLAAALLWALLRPSAPQPVARYVVMLAEGQGLSGSPWSRLAVSPDGSRLVYIANAERGTHLLVRARDELRATAIPGTDGATNPVFSPDGSKIAFMDRVPQGQIKVVSLTGGPIATITDSAVGAPGLTWGYDGFIYYDAVGIGPLMRVPESGGTAEAIGVLDAARGEFQHAWPDALPNGRGLLMTVMHGGPGAGGSETDEIAVLDLSTGTHRVLLRGVFARYVRSGHVLYVTADGTLMAAPFDQDRMLLTGEAVALSGGVAVRLGGGAVDLAVSSSGTLWYVTGGVGRAGTLELAWVKRDGSAAAVDAGWTGLMADPVLSPDGKRLAVSSRELEADIWIKELDQGPLSRLTAGVGYNIRPAWSADGRHVAFVIQGAVFQRRADGSDQPTQLLDVDRPVAEALFSPDGQWLIYRTASTAGDGDLHARRLGTDSSIVLVATPVDETSPALSPDGRWLAYVSTDAGTSEVYVRPFPTGDGRWQISVQGGVEPVWAHSGRELFYRTAGGSAAQQMAIKIVPGQEFTLGERTALFPLQQFVSNANHQQYAVAPGDQRFLMIRGTTSDREDQLVLVENFFEVLKAPSKLR